jgi:RES domain-containing protein
MEVFRISKAQFATKLTASGNPGRWNYPGERVIYCAASRALASLELLIHTSGEILESNTFKISVIYFLDDLTLKYIDQNHLPPDWNGLAPYSITQPLGSGWLKSNESALLKVPSSIILKELNYVINVNHHDFKKFKIIDIEDYICDSRLVEKISSGAEG